MREKIPGMIERGAVIIDVRSPAEFEGGANPKSVNLPLDRISEAALADYDRAKPVILCCASGARSGMALAILRGLGFKEVVNAGSWRNTIG